MRRTFFVFVGDFLDGVELGLRQIEFDNSGVDVYLQLILVVAADIALMDHEEVCEATLVQLVAALHEVVLEAHEVAGLLEPEPQLLGHQQKVVVISVAVLAHLFQSCREFLPDILDAFVLG